MITVTGDDIETQLDRMVTAVLTGKRAAVAGAAAYAKTAIRQQLAQAAVGISGSRKLPNMLDAKVYPPAGLAWSPAAVISPRGAKADQIIRQLDSGAIIRTRGGKRALAIPLHNQRDGSGSLRTPASFGSALKVIPFGHRGGTVVGVLAIPSGLNTQGRRVGAISAASRRMQRAASRALVQPGIGLQWIAMFILVKAARIPKKLDINSAIEEAQAQMPDLFERAFVAAADGQVR